MARELGMDPRKLGKLDNHEQKIWKAESAENPARNPAIVAGFSSGRTSLSAECVQLRRESGHESGHRGPIPPTRLPDGIWGSGNESGNSCRNPPDRFTLPLQSNHPSMSRVV